MMYSMGVIFFRGSRAAISPISHFSISAVAPSSSVAVTLPVIVSVSPTLASLKTGWSEGIVNFMSMAYRALTRPPSTTYCNAMPIYNGVWLPDLDGMQWEVFNSFDRALLVSGGRKSGKSWACLHRIARHMWETPNARVGMFTKVLKNSKDAGCWKNLHLFTMKQWMTGGLGMRYTTKRYDDDKPGPKVDGTTRTPFFRTTNVHGGESECMLFSLDNPNEAEAKLKEREFSMIYFSELSNFPDRSVLSLGIACLRMPYLKMEQQMWMSDTNPAPEGEDSWIYEVWYIERCLSFQDYADRQAKLHRPALDEQTFLEVKAGLRLIEINAVDNPRLSPQELRELKGLYAYDQALQVRFYDGKWVYGGGETGYHFRRFFKPNLHVAGEVNGPNEEEWEYLNPSSNCLVLITGFDLGETNNHAAVIIEKRMIETYLPDTKKTVYRAHFKVLDELVSLNEFITIEEFTMEFMRMIQALETHCGRQFDLNNCAYSDSSTLTKWSASASAFPATQVEAASFGRLQLIGVDKSRYTPRWRVQVLQQLLAFKQIQVGAHCFHTIRMLKNLKQGEGKLNFVLQSDDNRHIFDALTYALISELGDELTMVSRDDTGRRNLMVTIR